MALWTLIECGQNVNVIIKMHRLTASSPQELRIDLEDFQGNKRYARYSTFTVDNATTQYRSTAIIWIFWHS